LLNELGLVRRTINFSLTPTSKHFKVKSFCWNTHKEDVQSEAYMKWLNKNISLPSGVQIIKTSSMPTLLSTANASLPYNINGTLDVAIVDEKNIKLRNILGGMRLGIELKKAVCDNSIHQAILELIAANIYSEYPLVIVLTDLDKTWQFFWLEIGMIVDCTFELSKAITLIESVVLEAGTTISASASTQDAPYRARCNFQNAISCVNEDNETPSGSKSAEGLERIMKRPKIDPADLLPEDDIASMRDVFDVMNEDEIRNWKLRRVLDFAMHTPALQSCQLGESWKSMYS